MTNKQYIGIYKKKKKMIHERALTFFVCFAWNTNSLSARKVYNIEWTFKCVRTWAPNCDETFLTVLWRTIINANNCCCESWDETFFCGTRNSSSKVNNYCRSRFVRPAESANKFKRLLLRRERDEQTFEIRTTIALRTDKKKKANR